MNDTVAPQKQERDAANNRVMPSATWTPEEIDEAKRRGNERAKSFGIEAGGSRIPADDAHATEPPCALCGGPHPFDTTIPSALWNAVIREHGLPDYLCATCILRAFVQAGRSFTAELWSPELNGVPITVGVSADSRTLTDLRVRLAQLREKFDALLIAEVNAYGGIPSRAGRCGQETMALHEAIAALLAAVPKEQP